MNFKDVAHYYLNTGLKIDTDGYFLDHFELTTVELNGIVEKCFDGGWKPILYSLDHLTEEYLSDLNLDLSDQILLLEVRDKFILVENLPFRLIEELLKRHFNVFNIPEDQYIDKSTINGL